MCIKVVDHRGADSKVLKAGRGIELAVPHPHQLAFLLSLLHGIRPILILFYALFSSAVFPAWPPHHSLGRCHMWLKVPPQTALPIACVCLQDRTQLIHPLYFII